MGSLDWEAWEAWEGGEALAGPTVGLMIAGAAGWMVEMEDLVGQVVPDKQELQE